MMSAVAGLVPEVTTIVANAVTLHPVVPRFAKAKLRYAIPPAARVLASYLDPQWGVQGAPGIAPKLLRGVRPRHPPRMRQQRLPAGRASPTASAGRRCGATRTSIRRRTSGSARVRARPAHVLQADARVRQAGHMMLGRRSPRASRELRRPASADRRPLRLSLGRAQQLLPARESATHLRVVRAPSAGPPQRPLLPRTTATSTSSWASARTTISSR